MLCLDECLFSGHKAPGGRKVWVAKGSDGDRYNPRAVPDEVISVLGAASPNDGKLHYVVMHKVSFN